MLDKVRDFLKSIAEKIPTLGGDSAAMKYISGYALLLVLCVGLYILMICADWVNNGRPNLTEMRQFISTVVSGGFVAAVSFACKYLVDSNGNGIPDENEKENTNERLLGKTQRKF